MGRFLFLILLGVGGALLVRTFAFEGIYLASDSMAPTLPEGTHVFVNKWAPYVREPRQGEIVMFRAPGEVRKDLVKRVVALGGDRLEIRAKRVFLNGEPLDEPYVRHARATEILVGDNISEIEIPPGFVFVMGDNRDVSGDSRDWTTADGQWTPFLPVADIRGFISASRQ